MFGQYNPYNIGQQIVRVNGEQGANAYQMMPNSSALLLDETAPRLFLKTTDGAGYGVIQAFKLEKYEPEKPIDLDTIIKRIEKLERMVKDEKPTTTSAKRKESKQSDSDPDDV